MVVDTICMFVRAYIHTDVTISHGDYLCFTLLTGRLNQKMMTAWLLLVLALELPVIDPGPPPAAVPRGFLPLVRRQDRRRE